MKFAILVLLSGLAISQVAAYFSIVGLIQIFQALPISIQIMGGVLEVGKLMQAAWLHKNWNLTDWKKRTLGAASVVILMVITSIGIFGYLSKASSGIEYNFQQNSIKIEQLETRVSYHKQNIDRDSKILLQLDASIDEFFNRGYVTRGLEQREQQAPERLGVQQQIKEQQKEIQTIEEELTTLKKQDSEITAEVGPARNIQQVLYGSEDTDSLGKQIRIIIFLIMFVFDPLAVLLLLMAQEEYLRAKPNNKTETHVDTKDSYTPANDDSQEVGQADELPDEYEDDSKSQFEAETTSTEETLRVSDNPVVRERMKKWKRDPKLLQKRLEKWKSIERKSGKKIDPQTIPPEILPEWNQLNNN